MSNLGYLRPHQSCAYLTAGRLYPIVDEDCVCWYSHGNNGTNLVVPKISNLFDGIQFDRLPPDHGLGWVKCIADRSAYEFFPIGDTLPVCAWQDERAVIGGVASIEHNGELYCVCVDDRYEYIPPYQAEAPKENGLSITVTSIPSAINIGDGLCGNYENDVITVGPKNELHMDKQQFYALGIHFGKQINPKVNFDLLIDDEPIFKPENIHPSPATLDKFLSITQQCHNQMADLRGSILLAACDIVEHQMKPKGNGRY